MVSDCEGGELHLLDPERVPALRDSVIKVEIHDCGDSTISDALRERFAHTHDIEIITSVARDPSRYPQLDGLSGEDRAYLLEEYRPTMNWAYMEPRGSWPSGTRNPRHTRTI